ncbi:SDR family NAD(P)-dependent oxidoreductase [Lachnotalea glycerini]|nr:SDR family NAD(P)-dependent oxidoreductase [Lachnotalea glycerini]
MKNRRNINLKTNSNKKNMDIAVIGIACRFPDARNYHEFWENLKNGVNSIQEITKERWDVHKYYSKDQSEKNKSYCKWSGCLDKFEYFDNKFFNISPREALEMDPHQRQLLEVSWQCVEDAGIPIKRLQNRNTSVIMSESNSDYKQRAYSVNRTIDSYTNIGNYESSLANRISFSLGFCGQSYAITTACASGITVIHEAKKSLQCGESNYVLAGSANIIMDAKRYISYSKARMLSKDGQCKTFDEAANGFVPGEGVGVVLLQPLEDAIREKNHIYAVIKGSSSNHIGKHTSITVPSMKSQMNLLSSALHDAKMDAATVGYIEAHGTGTVLGDPIEVEALSNVFKQNTDKKQFCRIGSVKTNIGHLEGASGMAGFIKTVLMLSNRSIPKTLNINRHNPIIEFKNSPFIPAEKTQEWNRIENAIPLRAGVSAFGFGGSCSHILLEEYEEKEKKETKHDTKKLYLTLSAKSINSLNMILKEWKSFVESERFAHASLPDICRTSMLSRFDMPYRFGCEVIDKDQLKQAIKESDGSYRKNECEEWYLVLGDLKLYGVEDFKTLYDSDCNYKNQLLFFHDMLTEEEWKGLFLKEWKVKEQKRNTFIVYYAFAKLIKEYGFQGKENLIEGIGVWVFLALSEVVKVEQVLAYLSDKISFNQITLSRPITPFYDPVHRQMIAPFVIAQSYLTSLTTKLWVEPAYLNQYVQKAKVLYKINYTFQKFMEEWNEALGQYHRNVHELLQNTKLATDEKVTEDSLILLVIVVSSLRRLYMKWDITDHAICGSVQLIEFIDLILDKVAPKEIVVELLRSNRSVALAPQQISQLNENLSKLDRKKPYEILRKFNEQLCEIPDLFQWIEDLNAKPLELDLKDSDGILKIGTCEGFQIHGGSLIQVNGKLQDMLSECIFQLWLYGEDVNWTLYCPEDTFTKVSLPVYEFDQKAYLLPAAGDTLTAFEKIENPKTELNSGTQSVFHIEDDVVKDHIITGVNLIPGAALIAFALEQLTKKTDQTAIHFSSITISKPAIVKSELKIEFLKYDDDIYSLKSEKVEISKGSYKKIEPKLSQVSFREIDTYPRADLQELYHYFYKMGYQYKAAFQVIKKIYEVNHNYLAYLNEKEPYSKGMCSPYLLDGVIQSVLAACYLQGKRMNGESLYIPYQIKDIYFYGELKDACFVVLEKALICMNKKSIVASICVYDKNGRLVIEIKDLQMILCKKDFLLFYHKQNTVRLETENVPLSLFQPVWLKQEIPNAMDHRMNHAVIFMDSVLGGELQKLIQNRYEKVTYIYEGNAFSTVHDRIVIRAAYEKDYEDFWKELNLQNEGKRQDFDFYYLWSYEQIDQNDLEQAQDRILSPIFYLCKSLAKIRVNSKVNLIILVNDCFAADKKDTVSNYLCGGISGLAKTMMSECPRISIQVVDIKKNENTNSNIAMLLWREQCSSNRENRIAYRHHDRLLCGMQKEEIPNRSEITILRECGIYLIIGGMGGIGYRLIEEISKNVNATIIIIGSSALDVKRSKKLEVVNKDRAAVKYYQCDIADEQNLKSVLLEIKQKYKQINGVIHCGGINQDKLIIGKEWTEFKEVLSPKTKGTYLLNKLTAKEPLDFFVVCSSIVSVLGNIGQSDYATANGFVDTFMEYRRRNGFHGKSITINWTLWDHTGMGKNDNAVSLFQNKTGIITYIQGVKTFLKLIENAVGQVIVIADEKAFLNYSEKIGIHILEHSNITPKEQGGIVMSNEMEAQILVNELITMLGELLGVDQSEIGDKTDLREFGLDSITLNEFTEMMNQKLNIDINSTLLFEYPTMKEISEYLLAEYKERIEAYCAPLKHEKLMQIVEEVPTVAVKQEESENDLIELLSTMLSTLLGVDESDIDEKTDIREWGLDSISFNEFTDRINQNLGTNINSTLLFEYSTIEEIANYLQKECKTEMSQNKNRKQNTINSKTDQTQKVESLESLFSEASDSNQVVKDEDMVTVPPVAKSDIQEPMAIIGMSGTFPKAKDLDEFWENLDAETDSISEVPKSRWDWKKYDGDPGKEENKTNIKWGGFIEDTDQFDPLFFGISPREAESMDPQQRLLMMYVWKAIEDSGYSTDSISDSDAGIFVGTIESGYQDLLRKAGVPIEGFSAAAAIPSIGPNRMSFFLNIHGPSEPIETACSSALVAIHRAVKAIEEGTCSLAIAGGINTIVSPDRHISFNKAGMLCQDGHCKTFSANADGYVRSESVGMIVIKKLSEAEKDRDHIYAVIRGTAENHGGYANSLTAPNPKAQAEVIKRAMRRSGIDPRTVTYIEAHGTGTKLGDPIEINGLKMAYKQLYQEWGIEDDEDATKQYCGIGSVKTNIGHSEFAAGIVGVIKILLQLQHKTLAKSLYCDTLNPYIQLEKSPFYIVTQKQTWNALKDESNQDIPRRAGISSFGFGGVNSHVVIEEYISDLNQRMEKNQKRTDREIIVLSAKSESMLKKRVEDLLDVMEKKAFQDTMLADMAYTLQVGRKAMEERLAVVVGSIEELKEKLRTYLLLGSNGIEDCYTGKAKKTYDSIETFSNNEEQKERQNRWLQTGSYEKLLGDWVKGLNLNWADLYQRAGIRKRISLPSYAFDKERYWVFGESNSNNSLPSRPSNLNIHPLIQKNESNLREIKYSSTFTGEEFFLSAHVINGKRILPGAAYLEMAYTAVKEMLELSKKEQRLISLNHVAWAMPIVVKQDLVTVQTKLALEEDGSVTYVICDKADQRKIYNEGRALLQENAIHTKLELDYVKEQCNQKTFSKKQIYDELESIGFQYGEAQQGIEMLYVGEETILAKLALPKIIESTKDHYFLHPSLLDSAIQSIYGLMLTEKKAEVFIPFALEELTVYEEALDFAWVSIHTGGNVKTGSKIKKYDIDLYNKNETICASLKGLTLKKYETDKTSVIEESENVLFVPEWVEKKPDLNRVAFSGRHCVLFLEEQGFTAENLKEELKYDIGETECFIVTSKEVMVTKRIHDYVLQVFEQVKDRMTSKNEAEVLMQIFIRNEGIAQINNGLFGLLKTAEQENPDFHGQVILVDSDESLFEVRQKILENRLCIEDQEILYADDKRFVKQLKEVSNVDRTDWDCWREDGVYLLTGGTGELGFLFAKEIAKKAAHPVIILAGRSELGDEKKRKLKDIQNWGAEVHFKQVDVSKSEEVNNLIQEVLEQHGKLNGILHFAGINRDQYLLRKSKQEVTQVIKSKLDGMIYLDEATSSVKLDFFVLFSSLVAVIGNAGQADYATANAYMDAFSGYRNRLKERGKRNGNTISINWPLWKSGGMRMNNQQMEVFSYHTGLTEMDTEDGINAFYNAFSLEQPQVIVFAGNKKKFKKYRLGIRKQETQEESKRKETFSEQQFFAQLCKEIVEGKISEKQFSNLILSRKLPVS